MASQETKVLAHVRIMATKNGWRLFRNSVGMAWSGTVTENQVIKDRNNQPIQVVEIAFARRVNYGLAVGSSDLIGWKPVVITPDMVGKTIAQFVCVECKTKAYGATTEEQDNWLDQVAQAGGDAYIARPEGDGVRLYQIEPDR